MRGFPGMLEASTVCTGLGKIVQVHGNELMGTENVAISIILEAVSSFDTWI